MRVSYGLTSLDVSTLILRWRREIITKLFSFRQDPDYGRQSFFHILFYSILHLFARWDSSLLSSERLEELIVSRIQAVALQVHHAKYLYWIQTTPYPPKNFFLACDLWGFTSQLTGGHPPGPAQNMT